MELPATSAAQKAGITGAIGAGITEATVGLERAAKAAGGVLRGIFGGLPWNMDPSAIVNAVAGGAQATPDAGAQIGIALGVLL